MEVRNKQKRENLEAFLEEKHWVNKIKDFFKRLRQKCTRLPTKPQLKQDVSKAKEKQTETQKTKQQRNMIKRNQGFKQADDQQKPGAEQNSHLTISSSESSDHSSSSDSEHETKDFGRTDDALKRNESKHSAKDLEKLRAMKWDENFQIYEQNNDTSTN